MTGRRAAGVLLAILVLSGCAAPPVVQRVEVPVYTPCITAVPPKPVYEVDRLPAGANDGAKILALAIDWPVGRKYELALEALLQGCN